jgi:DNA-binding NarL/FixJ family response regulator
MQMEKTSVSRPKVLVADDHKQMVQSLVRFLDQDFEIVATVSDGRALVDATRRLQPDVIVADLSMPGMNGSEAFRELRTDAGCPFIFLTAYQDAGLAADLIDAGAAGFVLKQAAANELVAAIREVVQGGVYVSPLLSRRSDMGRVLTNRERSASS